MVSLDRFEDAPGHPPPRRREAYRRSIHMLNFTYEDDIKIKYKQVSVISRTYYRYLSKETISRPPQSRETIPLILGYHICPVLFAIMTV
jgi:hypothetical protein